MNRCLSFRDRKQSGFTLIELMITVAIFAILLSLATADYSSTINTNRLAAGMNQLQGELSYARSAAAKAATSVTLCSSTDSASCNGGSIWESGWIVFTDADADAVVDATDRILKVNSGLEVVTLRRSGFNYATGRIQFNSRGELRSNSADEGSFSLCGSDGDTAVARGVVVQISGSVRRMVDEDADGIVNDHSGGNLVCP